MFTLFFLKTILHLIFQLSLTGITTIVDKKREQLSTTKLLVIFILYLALLFGLQYNKYGFFSHKIPFLLQFIMFCAFSVINGLFLSSILKRKNISYEQIKKTLLYTAFIFFAMMITGFCLLAYDIDILPLMVFALVYSIVMSLMILYTIFIDVDEKTIKYKRVLLIGLFSLYIIIHTYTNFNKKNIYKKDLIESTLDYYIDITSIFQNMLLSNDD